MNKKAAAALSNMSVGQMAALTGPARRKRFTHAVKGASLVARLQERLEALEDRCAEPLAGMAA
jgi:hypothetical protein